MVPESSGIFSQALSQRRRAEIGVRLRSGRPRLPPRYLRERIQRVWASLQDKDIKLRYYRLHRAFPELTLQAIELVVRTDESTP